MPRSDYVKQWGVFWPVVKDPASVHLDCIKHGGEWVNSQTGETCGGGMEFHWRELIRILWPDVVFHKWFNLILEKYLKHRVVVIMGPASSGKTFAAAILVLVDYLCYPDQTTVICCSTTKERLEDRVWGCIKSNFKKAKASRPWLPGNVIEGRMRIVTDSRQECPDGRDFRNGLVGVATKRGETFIGISEFAGLKNKRVRLLGDELSMLPRAFVDSISNLDKNPDFKAIGLGNPKDTTDALGVLAEPAPHLGGWESGIDQTFGTKTWDIRRTGGVCIQLPGDDSPNLDGSLGIPLISQADIDRDISFYGKDSIWYTMMDLGRMPKGAGSRRVLTRQLCEQMKAFEQPMWRDSNLKRIAFMDAGYGGDRCIFGELVFGYESVLRKEFIPDASGLAASAQINSSPHQIIALVDTMVVPVNPGLDVLPEDQIVRFVIKQCEARGIEPENFFYESGMRTALVQAFGRIWSSQVESVDCMGKAADSPVSTDIQKPCNEYYANKLTEIWYSVRLAVEAGQFRGMIDRVLQEFCDREWTIVAGNKIQVEPKEKMKLKCFVAGTLIKTPTGDAPIESLKPGDWVETPFGSTRIYSVQENTSDSLFRIELPDGQHLCGTGDHKIFTWDSGWIPMCNLSLRSRLESVHDLFLWQMLKSFFTRETSISFARLVDITTGGKAQVITRSALYTGLSGQSIVERFLGASASIIKTVIGETINCLTWSFGTLASTPAFTLESDGRTQSSAQCKWQSFPPLSKNSGSGKKHPKLESGKVGKPKSTGQNVSLGNSPARSVGKAFLPCGRTQDSVLESAPTTITIAAITTRLQNVWCAAKSLWRSVTHTDFIAVKSVQQLPCGKSEKVYDLTLCEHNAYYANGVLVANCGRSPDEADAVAIGVFGARKRGFQITRLQPPKPINRGPDWRDTLRDKSKKIWQTGLEYATA